jgi:GTP-binding protein HflX
VSRLPTYIIEGFKPKLENWLTADLVLSLIDSSEALQGIGIKYSSCWQMLKELK